MKLDFGFAMVILINLLRIAFLKIDIFINDDSKCVDVNNE